MKYFEKSHIQLDNLNYKRLSNNNFTPTIKGVDFADAKANNKIEYREDGVYLFADGHWIRGYYYMANYDIDRYGSYPRFHLFNCSVMENKALYTGSYIWANDKSVNVTNRQTNKVLKDISLKLCSRCSKILIDDINSTQDFYDSNGHENQIKASEILTLKGYPMNWREIATDFKRRKGLICNICSHSDKQQINKWFYDVDHINGDKTDCEDHNLQVLCKLCHTYKDQFHLEQALKYPSRNSALHEFIKRNKGALGNNIYLTKYLTDFSDYS